VTLTAHLRLVPRSRIRGPVPISLHGVVLNHLSTETTLTLVILISVTVIIKFPKKRVKDFKLTMSSGRRSQWLSGLRHEPSSSDRTRGSWVRITLKSWISVCFYSTFVLFCVYVAALRWTDPPSKESYRLCIGLRN
jgi:hypothetical protein